MFAGLTRGPGRTNEENETMTTIELEKIGVNTSELITAVRTGLESLRVRGLVDPQGLTLRLEGPEFYWGFFKFCALPGHPRPGNASGRMPPTNMSEEKSREWYETQRSLYSHPVDLACFAQSVGRIRNPLTEGMSQVDALDFARDVSTALFGDEITEVEIARRLGPGEMGVTGYELPSGRKVRHGDEDADRFPLAELVLLRHGRTCWEEYPRSGTVEMQPDFEGKLGYIVDEKERARLENETL
jgi:hypothetical protein